MFASDTTETVTIGDVIVTIKKLNWKQLREAAAVQLDAQQAQAAKIPAELRKVWQLEAEAAAAASAAPATPTPVDPAVERQKRYFAFDQGVVLRRGVRSWTSDKELPAALDDLEEGPARQLHRAILDLSLPPIETGAQETARKNG